jgi:hypothetical protein
VTDRRDVGWDLEGDPGALRASVADGVFDSESYPDGLARLWTALNAPQAGDLMVSAELGYECVDWGGASHVGGGSHGSLHAGDSLGPMLLVGCEPEGLDTERQWALSDVAGLVMDHFGLEEPA